jgi:hypothetical protein
MDKKRIFVSYSHQDAALVNPVVKLLRVTVARELVFVDSDSIDPGRKWRETIDHAIAQAHTLVVFWCHHSSASDEVSREYRSAMESGKSVLPVLLDSTPMPAALNEYQWIDFRELARAQHARLDVDRPALPSAAPRRNFSMRPLMLAAAVVFLFALGISSLYLFFRSEVAPDSMTAEVTPSPAATPSSEGPDPPLGGVTTNTSLPLPCSLLLLALLIGFLLATAKLKRLAALRSARRQATPEGREMANRLRAEIQRVL